MFYYVAPISFTLDIIKNILSVKYINGLIERRHANILKHYKSHLLIYDVLAYVPFLVKYTEDYPYINFALKCFIFFKYVTLH